MAAIKPRKKFAALTERLLRDGSQGESHENETQNSNLAGTCRAGNAGIADCNGNTEHGSGLPLRRRTLSAASTRKGPNSYMRFVCAVMNAFTTL